jgi:hypothetical protein
MAPPLYLAGIQIIFKKKGPVDGRKSLQFTSCPPPKQALLNSRALGIYARQRMENAIYT